MWFRMLVLALGTFAIGTDSFVIAGILPDIAGDLPISLALVGLAVTVFALVYACGAPIRRDMHSPTCAWVLLTIFARFAEVLDAQSEQEIAEELETSETCPHIPEYHMIHFYKFSM